VRFDADRPLHEQSHPPDALYRAVSDYVVGTTLFVDGGMTLYPGFTEGR